MRNVADREIITELMASHEIRIRPRGGTTDFGLSALWSYRELLSFLAWRDIKVRYSQTLLGMLWAIVQPVAAALVFTAFLGSIPGLSSGDLPYFAFALAGMVPWVFFSNAVLAGANSIVANSNLVTKVYFPRILIPTAAVLAGVLDLALSGAAVLVFLLWRGVDLRVSVSLLGAGLLALLLSALGFALWMAALNVQYRDFRHALPFLLQLAFFATPVIYPASAVPEAYRSLLSTVNPMAGVIETLRAGLFATPLSGSSLLSCSGWAALAFLSGAAAFRWVEHSLADVI